LPRLRLGHRGPEVERLQRDLLRWMPGWKGKLEVDGVFGPVTRRALEFFKRTYGVGRDGRSLDPRTARMLSEVEDGTFWTRNPDGRPRYQRRPEMERRYQKALKTGYPLEAPNPRGGLSVEEVQRIARESPHKLVRYQGHWGEAVMFKRYIELEKAVRQQYPGYHLEITATTEGQHSEGSPHYAGRAIDCVLVRDSDGYVPYGYEIDSTALERLGSQTGFLPYNEYVYSSAYKTGDHMHLEMAP
jgi:peptidoglycan hydrolase-like protein with peptidoglycan-binding domain